MEIFESCYYSLLFIISGIIYVFYAGFLTIRCGSEIKEPSPNWDLTRQSLYNASINLVIHAENTSWTRMSSFLVASSILILAWATIFENSKSPIPMNTASALSFLALSGLILSLAWAPNSSRNRRYLDAYLKTAEKLEEQADVMGPMRIGKGGNLKFNCFENTFRAKNLVVWVPIGFAWVFTFLLIKSTLLIDP